MILGSLLVLSWVLVLKEVVHGQLVVNQASNQLDLPNLQRTGGGTFRFAINGVKISKVNEQKSNLIQLILDGTHGPIEIEHVTGTDYNEYKFVWANAGPSLEREVCFHYGLNNASWYGTYEEKIQQWPLDTKVRIGKNHSFTTTDFYQGEFGGLLEHLFLTSDGFGLRLEENHPWFVRRDPNGGEPLLCASVSADPGPYPKLAKYESNYFDIRFSIRSAKNIKVLYQSYLKENIFARPKQIPDEAIFKYPIWSTWAQYKKDISDVKILDFAKNIQKHGFTNSQLEIDDFWEEHYGNFRFDPKKFPNAKETITELHKLGFRVTLWVYPFVNQDSAEYIPNRKHFIEDAHGSPLLLNWWNGNNASAVDFSDPEAVKWFVDRLKALQNETGVDSFKFDAGEVSWYGKEYRVKDPHVQQFPSLMTTKYVEACAQFGGLIEVRAAYKSQQLPIWVRMLDKDSVWGLNNGIKTLVTTALMMSLAGYHFILPDMIGGNDYGGKPSEELYIRWVQANAFLPSLQFSIPPWVYSSEKTINITRKYVQLHTAHAQTIIDLSKRVSTTGEPVIRPMWYAEPNDDRTYRIGDQYMLGEDIVAAPVLEQGKTEREVYLPTGTWVDQHGAKHTGPAVIKVAAPIEELPYYKRHV